MQMYSQDLEKINVIPFPISIKINYKKSIKSSRTQIVFLIPPEIKHLSKVVKLIKKS